MDTSASRWGESRALAAVQTECDQLVEQLPVAIERGEAHIVEWVGKFFAIGGRDGLQFDTGTIVAQLRSAGYKADDLANSPLPETHRWAYARWIIGQALAFFEKGLAIHPMITGYTDKYSAIPE